MFGGQNDQEDHDWDSTIQAANSASLANSAPPANLPKHPETPDGKKPKKAPNKPPTTFSAWLFGVLNGGEESWILRCMESEFFDLARQRIKSSTGGVDIHMVMLAFTALNAARVRLPVILSAALDKYKEQTTSSVTMGYYQCQDIYTELFRISKEKFEESQSSPSRLRGQHEQMKLNLHGKPPKNIEELGHEYCALDSDLLRPFWHDGNRFILEEETSEDIHTESKLTVRCFGRSREPIRKLIAYAQQRLSEYGETYIHTFRRRLGYKLTSRNKRPLATVDLDPAMMEDIKSDVSRFFHRDSRAWYETAGRPYRHGYLLYGPPGTGKTSLALALASYLDVHLYVISLNGLDDELLEAAFNDISGQRCIVLLEDIDCVGANVHNRGAEAQSSQSNPLEPLSASDAAADALELKLASFMEQQGNVNERLLTKLAGLKGAIKGLDAGRKQKQSAPKNGSSSKSADSDDDTSPKSVSLSGLLNVIDGANAIENRLLIMTTNHPNILDPALLRAGRIERKFEMSYASKASSKLTFKRIFGNEVIKRFTPEAIDRFADLFVAQFPTHSRITTAELAQYCGQYGGHADKAVENFADWLKLGADLFTVPVDYTQLSDEEGIYNVAEAFDREQLKVQPHDLLEVVAEDDLPVDVPNVKPAAEPVPSWNPFTWRRANTKDDEFAQLRAELLSHGDEATSEDASLLDGFQQFLVPPCPPATPTPQPHCQRFETAWPAESVWDAAHHGQVCPVPLTMSADVGDFWQYQCVSPRPMDDGDALGEVAAVDALPLPLVGAGCELDVLDSDLDLYVGRLIW